MTPQPLSTDLGSRGTSTVVQCPICSGDVLLDERRCVCTTCGRHFRMLAGIPDLRVPQNSPIDYEEDWALACSLAEVYSTSSFLDLVQRLWSGRMSQETMSQDHAASRIGEITRAPFKHAADLAEAGWLGPLIQDSTSRWAADLGCGPGGFLVAVKRHIANLVGIDISMAWLIVCRKRFEEEEVSCLLICACAEHLPLKGDTFDLVTAFDSLEHVTDRDRMVSEARRIVQRRGIIVCTTPNRFSVSAEPHYRIWGVGLLPRTSMPHYVRWRTGQDYRFVYLLSIFDIRRLFTKHFGQSFRVIVPALSQGDIIRFRPIKRAAARFYNRVIRVGVARLVLVVIAPLFRIVARKDV